jgi:hypothetical protein
MKAPERVEVMEIYQTDLERHLFAPPPRPNRRRARRQAQWADRLRDWFMSSWTRWKELAEAAYM